MFTSWCEKYKLIFCFPKWQYSWCIGRYMSMYLWLSNSLHSILVSVLCSIMKQYWLKFHATVQRWIRVEPHGIVQPITNNQVELETRYHMVWFSQSLRLWSKWRIKMVAPTKLHQTLKEYEIIRLIYNRKSCSFRFIISVHLWIYFSRRSDLAGRSLKENTSKYKQLISDQSLGKHAYTIPSN